MTTKKYKPSIPRKMYWSSVLKNSKICPECGSLLENEYQSYQFCIKSKNGIQYFITGGDGGYFCSNCPIVVLDKDDFAEMASLFYKGDINSTELIVKGIVDLDAIPENKRNKPLGTKDNPIPLIPFTNYSEKI